MGFPDFLHTFVRLLSGLVDKSDIFNYGRSVLFFPHLLRSNIVVLTCGGGSSLGGGGAGRVVDEQSVVGQAFDVGVGAVTLDAESVQAGVAARAAVQSCSQLSCVNQCASNMSYHQCQRDQCQCHHHRQRPPSSPPVMYRGHRRRVESKTAKQKPKTKRGEKI